MYTPFDLALDKTRDSGQETVESPYGARILSRYHRKYVLDITKERDAIDRDQGKQLKRLVQSTYPNVPLVSTSVEGTTLVFPKRVPVEGSSGILSVPLILSRSIVLRAVQSLIYLQNSDDQGL